jgi:hypothetical protein
MKRGITSFSGDMASDEAVHARSRRENVVACCRSRVLLCISEVQMLLPEPHFVNGVSDAIIYATFSIFFYI